MNLHAVPSVAGIRVTARGAVDHQCPFKDEVDHGSIEVTWTTTSVTIELHSLAEWLTKWASDVVSHEELVDLVRFHVARAGVAGVQVTATFTTAGMEVTVGALPGNAIHSGRA